MDFWVSDKPWLLVGFGFLQSALLENFAEFDSQLLDSLFHRSAQKQIHHVSPP